MCLDEDFTSQHVISVNGNLKMNAAYDNTYKLAVLGLLSTYQPNKVFTRISFDIAWPAFAVKSSSVLYVLITSAETGLQTTKQALSSRGKFWKAVEGSLD